MSKNTDRHSKKMKYKKKFDVQNPKSPISKESIRAKNKQMLEHIKRNPGVYDPDDDIFE